MNKWLGIGRLTADPKVYPNPKGGCTAKYTIALDRGCVNADGSKQTDFIPCTAFSKNGEFAQKYLRKGMLTGIEGSIRTGSYEKDGARIYTTEVIVYRHYPCTWPKDGTPESNSDSNGVTYRDAYRDSDMEPGEGTYASVTTAEGVSRAWADFQALSESEEPVPWEY